MSTLGTRGKSAEKLVKEAIAQYSKSADFDGARWPDARAGSFVTALTDFVVMHKGRMTLLEVKEVAHDFRLPHKNLDTDQIATMRKWKLAKAQGHVLVYHTTTKLWRAADVSWFFLNHRKQDDNGKAVGSWDLRPVPFITLDDYFNNLT